MADIPLRARPYPPTYEQHRARKHEFVRSISHDAVCDLASRHNGQKPCRIFRTSNGSFNACFFVEFPDGTRWVVRVPIDPAVFDVWAKIQSEVATMQYIRSRTTIPVPRICAFGRGEALTRDQSTRQAFLILEYVPGEGLDVQALAKDSRERRDYFYSQLADILAQMRRLEFSSAGSLMPNPNGGPDPVVGPLVSMQANELQVELSETVLPSAAFDTATDFVVHQLGLIAEARRQPASELTLENTQLEVFAQEQLEKEVREFNDANSRWDRGPFVLSHLDLRWPNIIVDDDLTILAVIDWEWAGSIPRQLFVPPFWIAGREPPYVTGDEYRAEFAHFHRILQAQSERSDAHCLLAEEWDLELPSRVEFSLATLLQHHSQLIAIYYRTLYPRRSQAPKREVVPEFFARAENSSLALEAKRRFETSERYTQYLKDAGLFVPDEEAEAARVLAKQVEKLEKLLVTFKAGPSTSLRGQDSKRNPVK